jgi:methylase of polypeptide subunit release factors
VVSSSPHNVVGRLGEVLREAGFGRERHFALMGRPGGVPPAAALAVFDRWEDARLATLLRLFQDGWTLARPEVARAVDPLPVESLTEAGLLEAGPSGLSSRVRLSAISEIILAGDTHREWENATFVAALSPPGKAVALTTVRRPARTALDVCTGSGTQALLAARHAERVVGVDVNPHALALSQVNQRLNGVHNVEWVPGDGFEAVDGSRFGLVVANPPVVISPDRTMLGRDSAVGGETLSRQMVRRSAEHLEEGGFATVLCHWTGGADDGPSGWVADLGCDALVLTFQTQEPLTYALTNAVGPHGRDSVAMAETVERWLRLYEAIGVERISSGVVVLRRRSEGSNWVRGFQTQGEPSGPGGDQIERMFAGGDFLAAASGAAELGRLLTTPWRLVDGHRLDQGLIYRDGAYESGNAVLAHERGLNLSAQVDHRAVPVVVGCDGRRRLADLIRASPIPEGLDQPEFHGLCLAAVRELIAQGLLVAGPLSPPPGAAPPGAG